MFGAARLFERAAAAAALLGLLAWSTPSAAVPAFSRKYETSCETCHTAFPTLNPFGEAFRRDGFRFPSDDANMAKQGQVSLGSDAYKRLFPRAVWPGSIPASPPLAFGVDGSVALHPDPQSGAAQADDGAPVVMDHLVDEAHLWAGGSLGDRETFIAEVTAAGSGVTVERAELHLDDLIGPPHAVNLVIGRGPPSLTSFGAYSSYQVDHAVPVLATTALYGRDRAEAWSLAGEADLVELNGAAHGRFDWSVGIDTGTNAIIRAPQDVYSHVGAKIGGVRLDGKGATTGDPTRPWAEKAVTMDLVAARSSSVGTVGGVDTVTAIGASMRAQYVSVALDTGVLRESHDDVDGAGLAATAISAWDELSWVAWPWLVPGVRVEYTRINAIDRSPIADVRVSSGAEALVRANVKVGVEGRVERASGAPPAGWSGANGHAVPSAPGATVGPEVESIDLTLAYAF